MTTDKFNLMMANEQPVLFEVEKQIPQWLADYFYLANAGLYVYKQSFYTNVKPLVLKAFGRFSGYDLQVIQKKCWSCNGTGKYKRYYHEFGQRFLLKEEPCWHCKNGIYMTKEVFLERYILNGILYHIPCSETLHVPIINNIKGVIIHEQVDSKDAMKAYIILLWKYNKYLFYSHIKTLTEDAINLKWKWLTGLLQLIFKKDNTGDQLPF